MYLVWFLKDITFEMSSFALLLLSILSFEWCVSVAQSEDNEYREVTRLLDQQQHTMEQLEIVCGGQCYRGKQEYRAKIMNWYKIKEKKIKKFNF